MSVIPGVTKALVLVAVCALSIPAFAQEHQCISRTSKAGVPDVYYFPAKQCGGDKVEVAGGVAAAPVPVVEKAPDISVPPAMPAEPALQFFVNAPDVIEGFGSQIPLAIALTQIIPAKYGYKFAGNINPGRLVSWQGGKPWIQVLDDLLAAHGMRASISRNVVVVRMDK